MIFISRNDFYDFIEKKELIGIHLNCRVDHVRNLLGKEINHMRQEGKNKEILSYNGMDFYFYNDCLIKFSFSFYKLSKDRVNIENIELYDVKEYLLTKYIDFTFQVAKYDGEMNFLTIKNIKIGFLDDEVSYIYCEFQDSDRLG